MNRRKALVTVLALSLATGAARAQHVEFFKKYNTVTGLSGIARALTRTTDSNIVFTGNHAIPGMGDAIPVIKTTLTGDTLWMRHIGVPGKNRRGYSITQLAGGDLLVAGTQVDTASGAAADGVLVRLSGTGNLQWTKVYARAGYSIEAHDLRVLNDGYVFCGTIRDIAGGQNDAWMMKTDFNGDTLWSRTYGGAENDNSWQIEQTPDGGFLLAGGSYSFRSGNSGDDAWIVKTNAFGEEQWSRHYGSPDAQDWIWSMAPAKKNDTVTGYVFAGVKSYNGNLASEMFLAKIDTAGNLLWDKSMTGAQNFRQGICIEPAGDNGFYIAAIEFDAIVGYRLLTMKVDKNGNVMNKLLYGDQEVIRPRGMIVNGPGDAFITGDRLVPGAGGSPFLARIRQMDSVPAPVSVLPVEKESATLHLSPNPAVESCTITSSGQPIRQVMLMDMSGRIVRRIPTVATYSLQADLRGIPSGTYLLEVRRGTGNTKDGNYSRSTLRLTIQ